ncbi:MAG: FAD-dependent oxidoreductase [Deltaproteobacteria bacterium]|jgi:phytoene dehydrogenase-like protein|nr:FAD-dependent oxidoreductase [Deltaproteobacteria bacterium]
MPGKKVIIVGAGLAGLSCARHLMENNIPFLVLEANQRIGGRLKTDYLDGFILNHGFQVLQTAYPDARRVLDYDRLSLKAFWPGAIVRVNGKFHRIADPARRPQDLWSTLTAPIGTMGDRLKILRLAQSVRRKSPFEIFQDEDMTTLEFLNSRGFSEKMIQRFWIPFFAGVCLDPGIETSSRVFQYVLKVFAEGDVALPARGMAAIVDQLAEILPIERIRTGARVESVHPEGVVLSSGETIEASAVVLATEGPETARMVGDKAKEGSRGEFCIYYAAQTAPIDMPFLVLNGDGVGRVNSLTVPSMVAPTYAPKGQHLISVVVLGSSDADRSGVETAVRNELAEWFGTVVNDWRHLKTFGIQHALPAQSPPMPDPAIAANQVKPGLFICGEYGSVPGIQWALLSGRRAAEAISKAFERK